MGVIWLPYIQLMKMIGKMYDPLNDRESKDYYKSRVNEVRVAFLSYDKTSIKSSLENLLVSIYNK